MLMKVPFLSNKTVKTIVVNSKIVASVVRTLKSIFLLLLETRLRAIIKD